MLDSKDYELPKIATTACLTVSRVCTICPTRPCLSLRRSYFGSSAIGTTMLNAGRKPPTGFWLEHIVSLDRCRIYPTPSASARQRSVTFNAANMPRLPRSFAAVQLQMRRPTMWHYWLQPIKVVSLPASPHSEAEVYVSDRPRGRRYPNASNRPCCE